MPQEEATEKRLPTPVASMHAKATTSPDNRENPHISAQRIAELLTKDEQEPKAPEKDCPAEVQNGREDEAPSGLPNAQEAETL